MKFVAIADTHGMHKLLNLPEADAIIHAGDFTGRGYAAEVRSFLDWFSRLDYQHIIFIAGNHDFFFETHEQEEILKMIPENVIYLNDSGVVINGIKIWGSPVQPWFFDWAFNRQRGEEIRKHWNLIPDDSDLVITHGPVFGILDETVRREKVGCHDLLDRLKLINPKVHVCGHIHEAYGIQKRDNTTFINASVADHRYQIVNDPIVFEL